VDDVDHVITWSSVRDTFWGDYTLTVSESSAVDHDVELDRVVARLKVILDDVIPSGLSSLTVTPETWYYGLDYTDGSMVQDENDVPVTVSVPSSYIGTSGTGVSGRARKGNSEAKGTGETTWKKTKNLKSRLS
jgi:hypothetical protein